MLYTQADVDQIKTAIAQGVLQTSFGERTTTFRSLEDMRATLALMEAEVAAAAGTAPPRMFQLYANGKGTC
jgi:hypothetical protein